MVESRNLGFSHSRIDIFPEKSDAAILADFGNFSPSIAVFHPIYGPPERKLFNRVIEVGRVYWIETSKVD
ncbi:hypothetical protein CDAR_539881 [Caerostris darwini]|uniref:Uncharacterized protein n=1 Tax=Caerostris darwini TaxID=1538125 RepID=A0AAV4TLZ2_9ARAC|nr:hypothetical protein CDAR_539881 [Caerostris darwini]